MEPDPVETTLIVSMLHAHLRKPVMTALGVTCPGDVVDSDCKDEVVHHEETPAQVKKKKKPKDDKKIDLRHSS